jgi:hypothetical protein
VAFLLEPLSTVTLQIPHPQEIKSENFQLQLHQTFKKANKTQFCWTKTENNSSPEMKKNQNQRQEKRTQLPWRVDSQRELLKLVVNSKRRRPTIHLWLKSREKDQNSSFWLKGAFLFSLRVVSLSLVASASLPKWTWKWK